MREKEQIKQSLLSYSQLESKEGLLMPLLGLSVPGESNSPEVLEY